MPNYDLGTARGRIIVDSSTLGRSTAALDKLGKAMLAVGALGALAFGYAIKAAADFEEQLSRFKAVTNAPQKDMDALRLKALQLGRDSAYGAGEVVKAFVELGKSGATATQILQGMGDAVVFLAAAGEIPLADAADIMVNTLKQFQLGAEDAVHVANLLAGAANASTTEVDDLANSLRYAGPVAAFFGISIEDTAIALAVFGNAGIRGSAAGTAMRAMLLGIAATTPKARNALKELGIITAEGQNQFYNLDGTLKPLPEIFQLLQDKVGNLSPELKAAYLNAIFLRRGLTPAAIAAFFGAKGFEAMRKEVNKTSAHDVMVEKLNNLKGSLKILKASLETFAITIGEIFLPALKSAADFLRELTNRLAKLTPEQKKILSYVLLGVTAFFLFGGAIAFTASRVLRAYRAFRDLGGAIKFVGALLGKVTGLTRLSTFAWGKIVSGLESLYLAFLETGIGAAILEAPLLAIVAALVVIGAAAYLLWTNWDKVWGWIMNHPAYAILLAIMFAPIAAFILLIGALRWLWNNWDKIWGWIKQAASDAVDWILNAWDDLQNGFDDVVNWLGEAVDNIIEFFQKLPGRIVTFMTRAAQAVLNFVKSLPGRIQQLVVDAASWLLDAGVEVMHGLGYGLVIGLASIVAFFVGLPLLIGSLVSSALQWLLETGKQILVGLANGLVEALPSILQFFKDLPGWILGVLTAAGTWLLNTGRDILIGLVSGLISMVGTVLNFFIQLPGKILATVSNAGSWLVNTGVQAIAGFASGLPGRFASVLSWFAGLGTSIVNAVGDLGGRLVNAGERLIGGLLEGIRSAFEDVKDFVSGIADTIAGLKGPPDYDAKLLINNGKLIMESLEKGLRAGWPPIVDLLTGMSAMIGSPISGAVAYTSASGNFTPTQGTVTSGSTGRGPTIYQDVTIQALDSRAAAQAVESERLWAERTSGVA